MKCKICVFGVVRYEKFSNTQGGVVFDNVFRGDNLVIIGIDSYGTLINVIPISNIKIIGKGDARITGTDKLHVAYHSFFKEYQEMIGDFWGWRKL